MKKFHVSEDGIARKCVAEKIPCKLDHYVSKQEAQKSYEEKMQQRVFSNSITKPSKIKKFLNPTSFKNFSSSINEVKSTAERSLKAFAMGGYIPKTTKLNNLSKNSGTVHADLSGLSDKEINEFVESKYKNDKSLAPKKMTTARKAIYAATSLALVSSLAACGSEESFEPTQNLDDSAQVVETLNKAEEIRLKKDMISFGDNWTVYADGEQVAEIKGEAIYAFGDTYTMRSNSGNIVGFETEEFLVADRGSETYDANGEQRGHIDQNIISIGYSFNIYEGDEQVGSTRQNLSLGLKAEVKDMDGNVEYNIKKSLISMGSNVTVTTVDNNEDQDVDAMDAVWNAVMMSEIDEAQNSE